MLMGTFKIERSVLVVGDIESGPKTDILGQGGTKTRTDPCLDFFRHQGEGKE